MGQYIFILITVLLGSVVTAGSALFYFRWVRLERPPIGVFNGRDIGVLLTFIVALPLLYLILPGIVLTGFLILTFSAALYLGLRPLLRPRYLWPVIALLLAANIWVTHTLLGMIVGWQIYWVLNSIVVLLGAVSVSNLYVQGGMRLRHIAWFALILAVYDLFFTLVIPLTNLLADRFAGNALDPSIGFRMGTYNANIGLGDLLIYALFAIAAYKGFGRRGVISAFVIIPIFGAIVPALAPLVISTFIRDIGGIVVPAQGSFGPAAFLTYLWLSRKAPERSMKEWLAYESALGRHPIRRERRRARRAAAPAPVLADVQGSIQGSD